MYKEDSYEEVRSMLKKHWLVLEEKPKTKLYVMPNAHPTVVNAANQLVSTVKHKTGVELEIVRKDFDNVDEEYGVYLATTDEYSILKEWFPYEWEFVQDHDGFAIRDKGENCYIFGGRPQGVFFGVCDMLGQTTDVIWSRAMPEGDELIKKEKSIALFCNYYDKACFEVRAWHACGMGEHGEKLSPSTMQMFGRNKINGKMELYEPEYLNYGISPFAVLPYNGLLYFDELMDTRPELFMQGFDGKPKPNIDHDSFLNYYRQDVAEMCAQKYLDMLKEYPEYADYVLKIKAPDDAHFYMVDEDGTLLHTKPFTTDDGQTVYPDQPEYQSTVYWNFVNRMVKIIAKTYPNLRIYKVAYQYCELCPKTTLDEHIIVGVAPLALDCHYSYDSPKCPESNKNILKNIENWCKMCKKVCIYEYWQCFKGNIYSRPNLYVVQSNIRKYYELGVWGITPEGVVDSAVALGKDPHYDLNEMYYWITNNLMWNVNFDLVAARENFCNLAYGNAAKDMLRYYTLIEKGWEERDAYVVWSTGGDVYTKEFIINAGIADSVKETLSLALTRKINDKQKAKIVAIRDIVFAEIDKYSKFVSEDAEFNLTDVGSDVLLSQEMLDYKHNPKSEWNKAGEIRVFKDFNTMENYDPKANLSVKLLYDSEYMYFGYTVYDDMLSGEEDKISDCGKPIYTRTDGSEVLSYGELYIGGSTFNMSKYYGYISGIRHARQNECYVNEGVPEQIPISKNFKEAFFKHVGDDACDRYYFHVQAVSLKDIGVTLDNALPFGSVVYYSDRYGRVGWKGNGLWAKQGFSSYKLKGNKIK